MRVFLFAAIVAGANLCLAEMAKANPLPGDPVRGQTLYGACMGCHSLDDNDVGPMHRGWSAGAPAVCPATTTRRR